MLASGSCCTARCAARAGCSKIPRWDTRKASSSWPPAACSRSASRRRWRPAACGSRASSCSSASAWRSAPTASADRLRRLRARAHDRDHRPRADPLRGRPGRGLPGDPPGARLGAEPRARRHAADGDRHRPRGVLPARPHAAGGHARRLDRVRDRRRGDLRAAARLDAQAPARAHARGRGRNERPRRGAARDRLHRVDRASPTTAWRTWSSCSSRSWGSARSSASASAGSRSRHSAARTSRRAACTPSRRWRSSRSRSAPPTSLHGSGFLAVYLAGLAMGSASLPARQTVARVPRRPRLARPADDVLHARPARLPVAAPGHRAEGDRGRARARLRRAADRGHGRDRVRPVTHV